ncbi:BatA domain-containing protein [Sphingobium scionense]
MMPALLLPAALAGLLALLIPLAIHIARRSEQLPTDFAALRWLRQKPKPRSRLRFDEWLLLALRLTLLTLVVLWLAHPVLFGAASKQPYVALTPGVDPAAVDDKVLAEGRAHWLVPGYPRVEPGKPITADAIPLASLVRQLDADLPQRAPLTIIVPQILQGADAERPRLSRKVDWRIVPGAMPAGKPVPVKLPSIAIRADSAHAGGLRYILAVAGSWQSAGKPADVDSGPLTAPLPPSDKILFWMSAGTLPDALQRWIAQGGQAVVPSDALLPQGATPAPLWQDDLARTAGGGDADRRGTPAPLHPLVAARTDAASAGGGFPRPPARADPAADCGATAHRCRRLCAADRWTCLPAAASRPAPLAGAVDRGAAAG